MADAHGQRAIREMVQQFLDQHRVMTVAVASKDGVPWASPVYYANRGLSLYWLTNPSRRMASCLQENPRAVVCILGGSTEWQHLQGLQMEGSVHPVESPTERFGAMRRYVKRYGSLAARLLSSARPGGAAGKLAGMRFYRFTPDRCWFTDNGRGFGHRVQLDLAPPSGAPFPTPHRRSPIA